MLTHCEVLPLMQKGKDMSKHKACILVIDDEIEIVRAFRVRSVENLHSASWQDYDTADAPYPGMGKR